MIRREGVLSLWKGLWPTVLNASMTSSLRFGVQTWANAALAHHMQSDNFESLSLDMRAMCEFSGGFVAGLVLPVLFTPLELIKCRQQANTATGAESASALSIVRHVVYTEGIRGMYVGHSMTVLRSTIGNSSLFGSYVLIKDSLRKLLGEDCVLVCPASGVAAGCVSWFLCFPVDAIKTRMQSVGGEKDVRALADLRSMTIGGAFVQLWKEGSMYRGLVPVLLRAIPVHMAYLPVYDVVYHSLCKSRRTANARHNSNTG